MKKKTVIFLLLILLVGFFVVTNVDAAAAAHVGEDICKEEETIRVLKTVKTIVSIFRWVAPILVIIFGTMKFVSSILSADGKALSKDVINFIVRISLGILIFFIPTLVNAF